MLFLRSSTNSAPLHYGRPLPSRPASPAPRVEVAPVTIGSGGSPILAGLHHSLFSNTHPQTNAASKQEDEMPLAGRIMAGLGGTVMLSTLPGIWLGAAEYADLSFGAVVEAIFGSVFALAAAGALFYLAFS